MRRLLLLLSFFLFLIPINSQVLRVSPNYNKVAAAAPTGGPPSFLGSDGHTWGWYISDDLGSITKDGSNLVTEWADTLDSGHDLEDDGSTPTWSAGGITFDAVNDDLLITAALTLDQPISLWFVVKNVTWANDEFIFSGYDWYAQGVNEKGTAGTPDISFQNGDGDNANPNLTLNTFHVLYVVYLDNAGIIKVDATASAPDDPGSGDLGGFCIPQYYSGNDIVYQEIIIRDQVDAAGDVTLIYNYLKARYGL